MKKNQDKHLLDVSTHLSVFILCTVYIVSLL